MVKQTEIPLTAWLITPLITGCIIKFYQKKLIITGVKQTFEFSWCMFWGLFLSLTWLEVV